LLGIPIVEISEFLKAAPKAKVLFNYENNSSIQLRNLKEIYTYLSGKNPELKAYGYDGFLADMQEESYLKRLHEKLSKKDGFTVSFDQFKADMQEESNLKRLHENLSKKNGFTVSYNQFKADVQEESNLKQVFDGLASKYSNIKEKGYVNFKNEMLNGDIQKKQSNIQPANTPSHLKLDKIKVGDIYIDLPIPNGFVKIDSTMGNLLKSANETSLKTSTLLALYLSEEDYANCMVDEKYIYQNYIIVQVPNTIKNIQIGNKDYRDFLAAYKKIMMRI